MHDQYARRAALDSSPDDEQHELFTCGRTLRKRSHPAGYFEDKLQQEVLEYSAGTRSQRAERGRAWRESKRGHRGHIVRLLMGWPRPSSNNFRNCLTDLSHVISRGENEGPC